MGQLPKSLTTINRRTNEMPALFDDPRGGAVESMVVSRSEVDDTEEEGISGLDAGSRGASTTFYGCARAHFSCDLNGLEHALGKILRVYHRRVGRLAEA